MRCTQCSLVVVVFTDIIQGYSDKDDELCVDSRQIANQTVGGGWVQSGQVSTTTRNREEHRGILRNVLTDHQ